MLNYLNLSSRKQEKGNKKDGFRKTLFSFSFGISDGTANFLSFPLGKEIRMRMHCNLMIIIAFSSAVEAVAVRTGLDAGSSESGGSWARSGRVSD